MKTLKLLMLLFIFSTAFSYADIAQKDKGKIDGQLEKIMILFIGKKYENRKLLESELTYYINEKGFDAEPCIKYLSGTSLPDKEELVSILENNDFDGILLVKVTDLDVKKDWVNAKLKYGNAPTASVFYNYYDISLQYTPGYATTEITYELESTLFRTSDQSQLFTTTSKAYEEESLDLAMESFAKTTANQLKKSKFLLKTK
jgi:hypothetical protein